MEFGLYVSKSQYMSKITSDINTIIIYKNDGKAWYKNNELVGQNRLPNDLILLLPSSNN